MGSVGRVACQLPTQRSAFSSRVAAAARVQEGAIGRRQLTSAEDTQAVSRAGAVDHLQLAVIGDGLAIEVAIAVANRQVAQREFHTFRIINACAAGHQSVKGICK